MLVGLEKGGEDDSPLTKSYLLRKQPATETNHQWLIFSNRHVYSGSGHTVIQKVSHPPFKPKYGFLGLRKPMFRYRTVESPILFWSSY